MIKMTLEDALGSTVLDNVHLSGRPSNTVFLHTIGRHCVHFTDTKQSHCLAPRRMKTMSLETVEFQSGWAGRKMLTLLEAGGPQDPTSWFSLSAGHVVDLVGRQHHSNTSAS